ncbi:hypothetical protein H5410_050925 [Solanum commersonii]|uniref:Uncharacterized protein n=1 Tax=Solanum commersonii TaxID=4109 RepID=A0A9J5WWY7_SOLCO|nr:hypothetical protein H5410_050925 [Solanum commersonii]
MNIVIFEKELDGIQKINSPGRDRMIHRELFGGNDSTNQGLQHTQKSHDSIEPITRTDEAISGKIAAISPELRIQICPSSHHFHGVLTTGDCSHGEEVHLPSSSSKMAGQITGDKDSSGQAVAGDDDANNGDGSLDGEVYLTNISINLDQEPSQNELKTCILNSTTNPPNELQELTCRTEEQQQEKFRQDQARLKGQKYDYNVIKHHQNVIKSPQVTTREPQGQYDQQGKTGSTNLEVIDMEKSSQFSFGVKPRDTLPSSIGQPRTGVNIKYTNEICQDDVQDQQQTNNKPNTKPIVETSQAGKSPHSNSSKNNAILSVSDGHVNDNANGQMNILREEQEKGRGDTETQQQSYRHLTRERGKNLDHSSDQVANVAPNNYHKNFPKLSSNFDRHTNSNQQTQQLNKPNHPKEPNTPNETQTNKQAQSVEPAPYTVVQTLAARLRQIHATQTSSIELVLPRHTTKQGQPAVIYDIDDFMNKLVVDCKYTLIDDEDLTIGRWQPIEYENIPPYCVYCKHQGHMIEDCNFKIRDEDFKRRKELGAEMRNMNHGEQGQQGQDQRQVRPRGQEEQQHQSTKGGSNQQSSGQQQEEDWHVARRKNNKIQEEKAQRTEWQPTSPQNKVPKEHPQPTAQPTGINISNFNSFTNLNLQGKQTEDIQEQHNNARTKIQETQNRSKTAYKQMAQNKQTNNQANNKGTGIDSMLPIPISPLSSPLIGIIEVEGGMDGGCQERHTNLQEGGSKGGNLSHVLHEGIHLDHSPDLRSPATTTIQQLNTDQQKVQQQEQFGIGEQGNTRQIKEKQQKEVTSAGKQNKGSMAKDMGTNASTSNHGNTPKSKNKPRKKKREAAKKRQNIQQQNSAQLEKQSKEACKRFIMVDDQLGMNITPLNTQYMGSPSNVPPDKRSEKCQMNRGPLTDEYAVDNSEDELDVDNQSLRDPDEDDETSELLIRAFSPHPDICFADEVHQVAKEQGLSPRGIHLDKFQFQNQDTNTVTAGRPNTRLFTSKSAQ